MSRLTDDHSRFPLPDYKVAGIVLSAGDSSRMGFPKPLMKIGGLTFLERVVKVYRTLDLPRCVVLGRLASEIGPALQLPETFLLENPEPSRGPLSSLLIGLRWASQSSGIILHPVDHPLVHTSTVARLASVHRKNPACILIPEYQGRRGHPVLIPRKFYPDLLRASLGEGARAVVHCNRSANHVIVVDDPGIHLNIDTMNQYRRLTAFPPLNRPPSPTM